MSYWHTDITSKFLGGNNFLQEAIKFYKLSANLIKKHYGNVNLITDKIGLANLKNVVDWTSIETSLEDLPKQYKKVWSLGKLKAIKHISKKQEPFLHVDHDVFILKKIPENLLNKDIILQSFDGLPLKGVLSHFFNLHCKNKYLIKDQAVPENHYNCGIIGGNDYKSLYEYSSTSIQMVLDKENQDFWLKDNENEYLFEYFSKALIAEQYYLSAYIKKNNIKPSLLLNYKYSPSIQDIENGYIHLYGEKKYKYRKLFDKIQNSYIF